MMGSLLLAAAAVAAAGPDAAHWRGDLGPPAVRASILGPRGWYGDAAWWGTGADAGCLGAPAASGKQVFLPETDATNGSVAVPKRADDVTCYARTKLRRSFAGRGAAPTRAGPGAGKVVAVTINGELQRMDPNTTAAARVVRPYAALGFEVRVFLTLQSQRPRAHKGEWHASRFKAIPVYDAAAEVALLERLAGVFLDAGAASIETHLYDLARRPPQMPSSFSGANPGKSKSAARFQLVWPSYALHLLVHSAVWADVERWEAAAAREVDFLVKMRADAFWLADAPAPGVAIDAGAATVKACLAWDGLNDKVAVVPRRYAGHWMRLLEAYYDATLSGYKNSEQFQLALARRFHIPVKAEKDALAVQDFYFWLPAVSGDLGCFPWNYAGVLGGGRCACVSDRLCGAVRSAMCAGRRPLGNDGG